MERNMKCVMMQKKNYNKSMANRKILILSCGTGGGHNSAAKAIQESLLDRGINADFKEYLEIINPSIKEKVNKLYLKSTKGNGKVFKKVYHLGELYQKTRFKSPIYKLNSISKNKLYRYIKEKEYDYIITTHLFAAQALTAVKQEHEIHFMAIATDYVCIPFWEETNPDILVIPNEDLKENFINKGVKKEKLLPIGIPVSKCYKLIYDEKDCKKKLGLDENKKYVLILNGSMGFGNVINMVKNLLSEMKDMNFIISCGNNKKLLGILKDKYKRDDRIVTLSYVSNLNEYMASSEIVLTKPGGLTSTEVATIRKPLIHTMPIPGCENYNANFFCDRKMSIKCDTIQEVVSSTKNLLYNKEVQEELIKNQSKYIDKNACDKICNVIERELKEGKI